MRERERVIHVHIYKVRDTTVHCISIQADTIDCTVTCAF